MSDDKVIPFGGITRLDLPVDRILDGAKEWGAQSVVVIGWDGEDEFAFTTSSADGGEVLWLLEKAKLELIEGQ